MDSIIIIEFKNHIIEFENHIIEFENHIIEFDNIDNHYRLCYIKKHP